MNKFKRQNGFTLVELVVAVGVLAVVMAFSGVIFEMTAETRQISSANSEIMDKFRTIKRQLDADFSGLRKDSPVFIWFEKDNAADPNRYDQIMFFANGDFQSIQTYNNNGEPDPDSGSSISGNTARVWYGHGEVNGYYPGGQADPAKENKVTSITARTLSRRQHLLSWGGGLDSYDIGNINGDFSIYGENYPMRDIFEHDTVSLSQWQAVLREQTNVEDLVEVCMGDGRSEIGLDDPNTYHLMFSEGVSSFAVQWGYRVTLTGGRTEWRWFPSENPNKDEDNADSDFLSNGVDSEQFGICFNCEDPDSDNPSDGGWSNEVKQGYYGATTTDTVNPGFYGSDFFPQALKFTFRIYDEKGVIEGGRKFSYIVYLEK